MWQQSDAQSAEGQIGDAVHRERVVTSAKQAFDQIANLDLLPDPMTFEVLFTFYFGGNPALDHDLRGALADGRLTPAEAEAIFVRHIAPQRKIRELRSIGESLRDEVHEVGSLIGVANDTALRYGEGLTTASERLSGLQTHHVLNDLVAELKKTTKDARRTNTRLQDQLRKSEAQIRKLQLSIELLQAENVTDPVTSVGNRNLFDHAIVRLVKTAREDGTPLSLALVDVDHFKAFNDHYGHQIGDDVLRLVAASISQHIRQGDVVARFGGDEFAVLLPGSSVAEAREVGERVRRSVSEKDLIRRATRERLGRISLSVGVAELGTVGTLEELIQVADKCLFKAKRDGRDRVVG